ncbi:hypothetical protein CEXT_708981 [Caerostris extrusa]|uniref:Uncharacterized protein n=1 Tax=Caerostris extrusa TaxID=172846 RepID=A0AAV4W074_CAEEX|nr:hypothetical protein CEXT_708981 [Caerostris extrusa]
MLLEEIEACLVRIGGKEGKKRDVGRMFGGGRRRSSCGGTFHSSLNYYTYGFLLLEKDSEEWKNGSFIPIGSTVVTSRG